MSPFDYQKQIDCNDTAIGNYLCYDFFYIDKCALQSPKYVLFRSK